MCSRCLNIIYPYVQFVCPRIIFAIAKICSAVFFTCYCRVIFSFCQLSRHQQANANIISPFCILETQTLSRFNYTPPFYILFTCWPTLLLLFFNFFLRCSLPNGDEFFTAAAGPIFHCSWNTTNVRSNIVAVSSFDTLLPKHATAVLDFTYRCGLSSQDVGGFPDPSIYNYISFTTTPPPVYAPFLSNIYLQHTLSIRKFTLINKLKPTLP